jgi:hypothetical protein
MSVKALIYERVFFRALHIAVALFAAADARGADDPMACVKELAMPGYQWREATIVARIAIGKGGKAKSVDYDDAKPWFRSELDQYFKEKTRYAEACDGKTITFTVRYLVQGQETGHPVWEVRFRPPDEIIVVSHPMAPSMDPVRKLKSDQTP